MTSEAECLNALQEAAQRLEKSPTKAEYEELGLTPASATILRTLGGWNKAKKKAGLETAPSTGSRTSPKPDSIELPDGTEWEELSVDQRWHYRNSDWNAERTLQRRARLRAWVNEKKAERGCANCNEVNRACLDYHHRNPEAKEMAVGDMVTYGYGRDNIREEMAKCDVLCANCHRKRHDEQRPDVETGDRKRAREWLRAYKSSSDGCKRCKETDPRCLVFHHPEQKHETVAKLVSDRKPLRVIQQEVDRCELLCSNCHRKEHFTPPETER
ncbi:homing endonuclease associated repeat-containing protein [Salinibaculum rarum]|uniref:homing endonuclease associated repeat-containing protein n=1 Tax=Salinibaculum rarum TaxID=3058903 RepID=UPI0034E944CF